MLLYVTLCVMFTSSKYPKQVQWTECKVDICMLWNTLIHTCDKQRAQFHDSIPVLANGNSSV